MAIAGESNTIWRNGKEVMVVPTAKPGKEAAVDKVSLMADLLSHQRALFHSARQERQQELDATLMAAMVRGEELKSRAEAIAKAKAILSAIVSNKDHILPQLQQPYAGRWLPVEAEDGAYFLELLMTAASGSESLAAGINGIQWARDMQDEPHKWREVLFPLANTLASTNRLHKALMSVQQTMMELHLSDTVKGSPSELVRESDNGAASGEHREGKQTKYVSKD